MFRSYPGSLVPPVQPGWDSPGYELVERSKPEGCRAALPGRI